MATFDTVADFKNHLIRKAQRGALLDAPMSAALPTLSTMFPSGVLTIDTAYESLGKLSTDGAEESNEQEISDIFGWGDTSGPARRDIDRETRSLNVTAIETRRNVLERYDGVDLSSATAAGGLQYDIPGTPVSRERRAILLTVDRELAGGLPIYMAAVFPRVFYSTNGSQTKQGGDNPLNYPMTLTAMVDATAGTACRRIFGGPGWAAIAEDMGFPA